MELYDILSENLSRLGERHKIMRHLMSEEKEIDLFWPILIFTSYANTIKVNLLFSFNFWITHCSMCSVRWGSGVDQYTGRSGLVLHWGLFGVL